MVDTSENHEWVVDATVPVKASYPTEASVYCARCGVTGTRQDWGGHAVYTWTAGDTAGCASGPMETPTQEDREDA